MVNESEKDTHLFRKRFESFVAVFSVIEKLIFIAFKEYKNYSEEKFFTRATISDLHKKILNESISKVESIINSNAPASLKDRPAKIKIDLQVVMSNNTNITWPELYSIIRYLPLRFHIPSQNQSQTSSSTPLSARSRSRLKNKPTCPQLPEADERSQAPQENQVGDSKWFARFSF